MPSIKAPITPPKNIISAFKTVALRFKTSSTYNLPRFTPHRLPVKALKSCSRTPEHAQDSRISIRTNILAAALTLTIYLRRASRSRRPKHFPGNGFNGDPPRHEPVFS